MLAVAGCARLITCNELALIFLFYLKSITMKKLFFFVALGVMASTSFAYGKTLQQKVSDCRENQDSNCYSAGHDYEYGTGVRQDYKKAKELYEIGCNNSELKSCSQLANLYLNGKGVPKNRNQAIDIHMDACLRSTPTRDGFDPGVSSCNDLGEIYREAKLLGLAKEYFGQACDKKSKQGCEEYSKMNN